LSTQKRLYQKTTVDGQHAIALIVTCWDYSKQCQ